MMWYYCAFSICAIAIYLSRLISVQKKRPKDFPPGPRSWPIFGNLLQLGSKPYKTAMTIRTKYGDIFAADLGALRTVFINDYKLLKEAFSLSTFSEKPYLGHFAEEDNGIVRGIIFTSGQLWAEQRKFAFSYIKSGLRCRETLGNQVMKEIADLIENLKKTSGTPINTRHTFNISAVNTLWTIVAGKRYSVDDADFKTLVKHSTTLAASKLGKAIIFFPNFFKLFPKLSGYENFRSNLKPVLQFMRNIVAEHKETYEEGVQRDFVDSYLLKIKSTTDPNSSFYGKNGETNLLHTIFDLFLAGTDTVSSALSWYIFLMAHFPEIQEKVINNIASKLDVERPITLEDQTNLPYVDAVIQEVLRFASMAPLGSFHATSEDVDFHGYKIPKGMVVASNLYGIMHDPKIWGDPENFRPERFLSEDGLEVIRHPAVVPFGVGRRSCPGEAFARDELFLFVTSLSKNFRVEFDISLPKPELGHIVGNILQPVEHKVVFYEISK